MVVFLLLEARLVHATSDAMHVSTSAERPRRQNRQYFLGPVLEFDGCHSTCKTP